MEIDQIKSEVPTREGARGKIYIDNIIQRLLEVRGSRPGKTVQLAEDEVRGLCLKAREIFLDQPILLELEVTDDTNMKIAGDIHGQYYDLLRLFEYGGYPPKADYLFLGNYVDYGLQSIETMCLLLAYKIKYPENFFLLRGNHECASINRKHGFYDECMQRYNIKLWKTFTDCFNCLPVAAIIDEKIFCVHGGLSPILQSMEQIRRIMRPTDIPDTGLLRDLMWADPDKDVQGWGENDNEESFSFTFGDEVVAMFLHKHDFDLVCRGHQVVEDGYEFFAKRKLVTLFSAANWKGEYDNVGAMMSVDETLMCSFQILKGVEKKKSTFGGLSRLFKRPPPSERISQFQAYKKLGGGLDQYLSTYAKPNDNIKKSFNNLRTDLGFESFQTALTSLSGVELEIMLMVLYQICPDAKLKEEIDKLSKLPQINFKSLRDVLTYANAVRQSGTIEEAKGMIVVVGNSGVGKSSFVRTLRAFCQNVNQTPQSKLTGQEENITFIDTKVLEVYENVVLEASLHIDMEINHHKDSTVNLINFDKTTKPEKSNKNFGINFYDCGGHLEYFICSSLFMKENGVFIICFDSSEITLENYFSMVGTYIELISECCQDPTYVLMTTKVDTIDTIVSKEKDEVFSQILRTATDHVCSITARTEEDRKISLVNNVFKTSSKEVTREMLQKFSTNIFSLFQNEEIMDIKLRTFPVSWKSLITAMKSEGKVSLGFVQEEYEKVYLAQEDMKDKNMDKETIDFIDSIENFINNVIIYNENKESNIIKQQESQLKQEDIEMERLSLTQNKIKVKSPAKKIKNKVSFFQANVQEINEKIKIEIEGSDEVDLILSLFSSLGDILWFKFIEALNDVIIPQPMILIKSIRQIIRHDIKSPFEDTGILVEYHEMIEKGFVSKGCFDQLYADAKSENFSNEETWQFLINLGLASFIEDPLSLYVPSLIDDKNEEFIRKEIEKFQQDHSVLGFHYHFKRTKKVSGLYGEIISRLASKRFVYEGKSQVISFKKAFSQKIENRRLGVVAGLKGSLYWTTNDRSTPAAYDFLILEYDTNYLADKTFQFARHKGIRVYLKPREDTLSAETFSVISLFDDAVRDIIKKNNTDSINTFQRLIICEKCSVEGREGYFQKVDVNFRPTDDFQECTNDHPLNQKHKTISPPKPFSWDHFLKDGIQNIQPKEPFSKIWELMKVGKVEEGEQIWIYRDETTACCNPVARVMPYAHVVIYVGLQYGIHEVVHVTKNTGCCPGILMSKIDRVNIKNAIKPHDQVFFGHQIPEMDHSINIRQKIKARAIACAEPPKLVFDYNNKSNCEGFANLMITPACACSDDADIGAQKNDNCCISCICSCIGRCKGSRRETKQLKFVVRQRLEERGLLARE